MKVVKIDKYSERNGKYHVYLGNGRDVSFTRKRDAISFLGATNKTLTQQLYKVVSVLNATNSLYLRYWGFFSHDKKTMDAELRAKDRECKKMLGFALTEIDMIAGRSNSPNGNYFTFKHFENAGTNLKSALAILKGVAENKGITNDLYEMDNIQRDLDIMYVELYMLGSRERNDIFKKEKIHYSESVEFIPEEKMYLRAV